MRPALPKRHSCLLTLAGALAILFAPSAQAAVPTVGTVSATNIQGVSALLKGKVSPQGLPTSAYFEYGAAPNLSGAMKTSPQPAGSGLAEEEARAAIAGLAPNTTYYFRLVASNSSGTTTGTIQSFKTTKGFGFLPGEEGFAAHVYADGGQAATVAGSHPYQLSFAVGLNEAGEFEDQPGAVFSDGDLRHLRIEVPSGLILNPQVTPACTQDQFHTRRSSPFEASASGESCPDQSQVGTVTAKTATGERSFGLFSLEAPPGVVAELGFAPFGSPLTLDVILQANPDGSYTLVLNADEIPQSLALHGLALNLWGIPWGVSHNGERGDCLNEAEPGFPWAKCSVGSPASPLPRRSTAPKQASPPRCTAPTCSSTPKPSGTSTTPGPLPPRASSIASTSTTTASPAPPWPTRHRPRPRSFTCPRAPPSTPRSAPAWASAPLISSPKRHPSTDKAMAAPTAPRSAPCASTPRSSTPSSKATF